MIRRSQSVLRIFICNLLCLELLLTGCHADSPNNASKAPTQITLWAHAGQAGERETLQGQITRYNASQQASQIVVTFIPERTYNSQVQAAAVAGDLPDILEIDGPYLANYAWQKHLHDLTPLLPAALIEDLLPSIRQQGTYQNTLYGVGSFDSGLAIYARPSLLKKAGISNIPQHPKQAWTIDKFEQVLVALSQHDEDGAVLDVKMNYPDEWFTYAFSPFLQSAGADLIERQRFQSADNQLNNEAAISAMKHLQLWLQKKWIDLNLDDNAFINGRVALSLSGHWEYQRYHDKWKDDLVLIPLPDFGKGSKSGQGSWLWSVNQQSQHPAKASAFIVYLLQTPQILSMCKANGAVPATKSAIAQSALYNEKGPLHLFVEQLKGGYTIPRPRTPAYPVISASFRRAIADIRNGGDVKAALDLAVKKIDQDIRDNKGYPRHD